MTEPGTSFLSGGQRPSFFRYVVRLYSSDPVFRGVADFAAIGAVVLLFLHPPSKEWFRGWLTPKVASTPKPAAPAQPSTPTLATAPALPKDSTPPPVTTAKPAPGPSPTTAPAGAPPVSPPAPAPAQTGAGTAPVSAAIAMPALEEVGRPRLWTRFLIEIDENAFQSSQPEDRQRLVKATQAHRARRFGEMLDNLAGARSEDPNVAFMRGLAAIYQADSDRFSRAISQLRAAVAGGQLQAGTILGVLLVADPGGKNKDVEEGKRLIEAAAARGDPMAQRAAGIGHMAGEFGLLDPFKAAGFLKSATAAGDLPAMLHYARMMFTGAGVEKDEAAAEQLLERAAGAGLTIAQVTLGAWILERYKAGVIPDPSEGVRWLERAYREGFSMTALIRLAVFYSDEGRGPWRDRSKALELFSLGVPFADGRPHFGYATLVQAGSAGVKDPVKAYTHYDLARQFGNTTTAPQRMKVIEDQISAEEKTKALDDARLRRRELKPIPGWIIVQRPDVPRPASPWASLPAGAAGSSAAGQPAPVGGATQVAPTPPVSSPVPPSAGTLAGSPTAREPPPPGSATEPARIAAHGSVAAVFERLNLLGTFAIDCKQPITPQHHRIVHRTLGSGAVERELMIGPAKSQYSYIIDRVQILRSDEINTSMANQEKRLDMAFHVDRGRIRTMESGPPAGAKIITGGNFTGGGGETPWYERCGS